MDSGKRISNTIPATIDSTKDVEEVVRRRLNGRIRAFQLIVESQGLVLRGKVRTYYVKQLAQQAVMEACKVRIWANAIEVVSGDEA